MRPRRIADLFQAHHLQTLDCKGLDVGTAERPRRPIDRFITVACDGEHQQCASRRDEAANVEDDGRTQAHGQGLGGVGLHHKVETLTPLGRRIQQIGDPEVHRTRREPAPCRLDRGFRDVEGDHAVSVSREERRVVAQSRTHHQGAAPRTSRLLLDPLDQQRMGCPAVPGHDRLPLSSVSVKPLKPARSGRRPARPPPRVVARLRPDPVPSCPYPRGPRQAECAGARHCVLRCWTSRQARLAQVAQYQFELVQTVIELRFADHERRG